MIDLLVRGGPFFTLPLTLISLLILILSARIVAAYASGRFASMDRQLSLLLHAGIFGFVFALLGHALSLYQMITAVEAAGGVAPEVVLGGLRVSLIVPLFGLSILVATLLLWISLRYWRDRNASGSTATVESAA